ncbi:MAG: FAD-dependent oxidoreductase [Cyanobacteriota bacterium]
MKTSHPLRIAIAGAGSAGLLTALLLQRQGHRVTLLERAQRPRTEGCGILLVSRGVQAVAEAGVPGLVEQLIEAGAPVQRFHVRNLQGSSIEVADAAQDPDLPPSLLIRRAAILEVLWLQLDPSCFLGGASLVHCQQHENGVEVQLADGQTWSGDLLIGADGLFSRVAAAVAPERRLHYLGDRVWRGVVADPEGFCGPGDFYVYARGRGIYANYFHLGPDAEGIPQTHWGFFQEEELPTNRSLQKQLLQEPIPPDALAKLCPLAASLIASTPIEQVVANWSYDIDPLPRLVNGSIALIGDAAHAMSSSQARGMTAGLEDAVCLARCLEASAADPRAALEAYASERLPVVHGYQQRSREVSSRIGRRRPRSTSLAPQQVA